MKESMKNNEDYILGWNDCLVKKGAQAMVIADAHVKEATTELQELKEEMQQVRKMNWWKFRKWKKQFKLKRNALKPYDREFPNNQ